MVRRAQQSGQDPQEFANHMFEHNHIPELVAEIRRGKALAEIVESATVTDGSGNVVDLKNLRPDGTLGDPAETAESTDAEADAETTLGGGRGAGGGLRPVPGPRLLDAAALLAEVADELVVRTVRDTHLAWADRVHGALRGPTRGASRLVGGAPPRGRLRRVRRAGCGPAGDLAGSRCCSPSASSARRWRTARRAAGSAAAVNGLIGDRLARERPRLAVPARRTPRRSRRAPAHATRSRPPSPTRRAGSRCSLHGLSESESAFDRHRDRVGATYADTLDRARLDPGAPPGQLRAVAARERRRPGRAGRRPSSRPGRSRSSGWRWSATRWAGW